MTDAELVNFVESNPELLQLYSESGQPTLVAGRLPADELNYQIGESGMFEARTARLVNNEVVTGTQKAGAITYRGAEFAPGQYRSSIHVSPARFTKAIKLYMTPGHELHHFLHYYNGVFDVWLSIGGPSFARNMTETVAHQWAINSG